MPSVTSTLTMGKSGSPVYGRSDGVAVVPDAGGDSSLTDGLVAVANGSMCMPLEPSMWCHDFIDFLGYQLTADVDATFVNLATPWVFQSGAGTSPVTARVADHDNGAIELSLSVSSEAADIELYWGDELNIDSDQGPILVTRLQLVAQGVATDSRGWGFAGPRNTNPDSTANNAFFKVDGANMNLLLESDDATTNDDDNDTLVDLTAATYYEFMLSMNPIHGGSATDAKFFYRATLGGEWTGLLTGTTFAYGADIASQPYFFVEKSAGTGTPGLYIDYIQTMWLRN
jgi:hypothetical protein